MYITRKFSLEFLKKRYSNGGANSEGNVAQNGETNLEDDATIQQNAEPEKTFTQTEVNAMMAKEKKSGKSAAFKALGFANEEDAKNKLAAYDDYMRKQKTDSENLADDLAKEKATNAELTNQVLDANVKIALMSKGANPAYIDELMVLAKSKISDDNSIDVVIEELKKKTPVFFENTNFGTGTGNSPGHQKQQNNGVSLGASLAKQNQKNKASNPYFKK